MCILQLPFSRRQLSVLCAEMFVTMPIKCRASKENGVFGDARAIANVCESAERSKRPGKKKNSTPIEHDYDQSLELCEDGWDSIVPLTFDVPPYIDGSNNRSSSTGRHNRTINRN
mmetsp:Transcript_1819/g.5311  ORF Transcript_1819/g.5311 Transcript_1819/m.5311 type:complete len:115 (+) Transcript_1819:689-1033(+)